MQKLRQTRENDDEKLQFCTQCQLYFDGVVDFTKCSRALHSDCCIFRQYKLSTFRKRKTREGLLQFALNYQFCSHIVLSLTQLCTRPWKKDPCGWPVLFYVLQYGNIQVLEKFLQLPGADPRARIRNNEKTALIYAVQQNMCFCTIELLIEAGAHVNDTDQNGKTALYYAFVQKNKELGRLLFENGANELS